MVKKCLISVCLFCFLTTVCVAQQPTVIQMRDSAKTLLQHGDYYNATQLLEFALQHAPGNLEVLKDLSFASYLHKDFSRAIETGKQAVESPDADPQAYQILGLSYKELLLYKECGKLYKSGLKKFPTSGVLYNEYAELLAMDSNLEEAIIQWEKGIKEDPEYSSNYYNALMYYANAEQWVRVLLYGELFVNRESYTTRTEAVKTQVITAYKKLYNGGYIRLLLNNKSISAFEKAVLEVMENSISMAQNGITPENMGQIRRRFLIEWRQQKANSYPFHLFDHEEYLVTQNLFDAYNQWLFGEIMNPVTFHAWEMDHPKEVSGFKAFQQNRVFKIPTGQYYFSK